MPAARVVIAEDDPDLGHLLSRQLERAGYEVSLATDHDEALALASALSPAVLLLDYNLPGGGAALHARLRRMPASAQTPILFLTAITREELARGVVLDEKTFYLAKPCRGEQLLAAVAQALG